MKRFRKGYGVIIGLVIAAIVLLFLTICIVPSGYTGVKTIMGQIQDEPVYGVKLRIPFIQSVKTVNNKQQNITVSNTIWSETSERTAIYYENINISYKISPERSVWLYKNVNNYEDNLIEEKIVSSAVKASSKQLKDTEATDRSLIEPLVMETLQKRLDQKFGDGTVYVAMVTIGNVDFDKSYNEAIEKKNQAKLAAEEQEYLNEQALKKAEGEAAAAKVAAENKKQVAEIESAAEALRITTIAEAQAAANEKIAESYTDELLRHEFIEAWKENCPQYLSGDASSIIIDMAAGSPVSGDTK